MPPTTKERALDAAVEVLGTQGVRALSHPRIDETAGLPPGSTSNWFRTRRALLAGVVAWIVERELADAERTRLPQVTHPEALATVLTAMVEQQTGPFATRTRARYALFLELSGDEELAGPLLKHRKGVERWTEHLVTRAVHALARGDA